MSEYMSFGKQPEKRTYSFNNHVDGDGEVDELCGLMECGGDGRNSGEVDIGG